MRILEDIGLTKKEAEVYETLLRLGESPISALIKATGSHPQVVYRIVDSLIKKCLVVSIRKRNRRYVTAESPKKLLTIEEERMEKLKKALPELNALQQTTPTAVIRTAIGEEAVRSIRARGVDELKRNGTYHIIGASGDRFYDIMGDRYAEIERKRIKKRISKKMITFANQREKFKRDLFRELTELRFLPDSYPIATSTNIFGNTVAIIVWSVDPIVIMIESNEVAESNRQYFEALWQVARQ